MSIDDKVKAEQIKAGINKDTCIWYAAYIREVVIESPAAKGYLDNGCHQCMGIKYDKKCYRKMPEEYQKRYK